MSQLASTLQGIYDRGAPPDPAALGATLVRASRVLAAEPSDLRPRAAAGYPGGAVRLAAHLPTVIVPDLHARMELILAVAPPDRWTPTLA